jgi:hypothetical protein
MIDTDMLITLAVAAMEARAQEQETKCRIRALLHCRELAAVGRLT